MSGTDQDNAEGKGGLLSKVGGAAYDRYAVLDDALAAIVQAQKNDKDINNTASNWMQVYSLLDNPDNAAWKSADLCLHAVSVLKPGTDYYNQAWALFQSDIAQMEHAGETGAAVEYLERAITGKRRKTLKGNSPAETLENVKAASDIALAAMDSQEKLELTQQLASQVPELTSAPVPGQLNDSQAQFFQQSSRLIRFMFKEDAGKSDPDADDNKSTPTTSSVPEERNGQNVMEYLSQLNIYSKKNLKEAPDSLADVLATTAKQGAPADENLWNVFDNYIGKLSGRTPGNEQQNMSAANEDIQKVWNALPEDDKNHRAMLRELADANGYSLTDPSQKRKSQQPQVEKSPHGDPPGNGEPKRFTVTDTNGIITPALPGPGPTGVVSIAK